jgi:hypothetical protein
LSYEVVSNIKTPDKQKSGGCPLFDGVFNLDDHIIQEIAPWVKMQATAITVPK